MASHQIGRGAFLKVVYVEDVPGKIYGETMSHWEEDDREYLANAKLLRLESNRNESGGWPRK